MLYFLFNTGRWCWPVSRWSGSHIWTATRSSKGQIGTNFWLMKDYYLTPKRSLTIFPHRFFSCVDCIIVLKIPLTNVLKHVRIILFKPFLFVLTVMVSVWDGNTFKKVKMTLLEISSAIVKKVVWNYIIVNWKFRPLGWFLSSLTRVAHWESFSPF